MKPLLLFACILFAASANAASFRVDDPVATELYKYRMEEQRRFQEMQRQQQILEMQRQQQMREQLQLQQQLQQPSGGGLRPYRPSSIDAFERARRNRR